VSKSLYGASTPDRLIVLENTSELVLEKIFPPNQSWEESGRIHLHPHQDEQIEVLEGILNVRLAGEERTYVAGEAFQIVRGIPHLICNRGSKLARARWKVRPPMNSADFVETTYRLSREGKLDNLLQQVVIDWAYREVFIPADPPRWVQPLIFAPLAMLGKLLGYRAHHRR
jgi:quercetin dioxygenase-like cupin family protein